MAYKSNCWGIEDSDNTSNTFVSTESSSPNQIMMEGQPHIPTIPTYVDTASKFKQSTLEQGQRSQA